MTAQRLHPDDVRAIVDGLVDALAPEVANALAERLAASETAPSPFVDAHGLAAALGVSRDFVYQHAAELGGVKLGTGPKAPWRFDVAEARQRRVPPEAAPAPAAAPSRRAPRRARRPSAPKASHTLVVRGGGA